MIPGHQWPDTDQVSSLPDKGTENGTLWGKYRTEDFTEKSPKQLTTCKSKDLELFVIKSSLILKRTVKCLKSSEPHIIIPWRSVARNWSNLTDKKISWPNIRKSWKYTPKASKVMNSEKGSNVYSENFDDICKGSYPSFLHLWPQLSKSFVIDR